MVFARLEAKEVPVEIRHGIGRQLKRDSSLGVDFISLDDAFLRAPAITGHPGEGGVEPGGSCQQLSGIIAAEEEDSHMGIGLLEELADHSFVGLLRIGTSHLDKEETLMLPHFYCFLSPALLLFGDR